MTTKEALCILELDDLASEERIKKAYKKMVQKYHPDNRETRDEDMFIKVKDAYECLKDKIGTSDVESKQEDYAQQEICPLCGGTGKRKIKRKTQRGIIVVPVSCETCNGTGYIKG